MRIQSAIAPFLVVALVCAPWPLLLADEPGGEAATSRPAESAVLPEVVRLKVPFVRQKPRNMCGAACVEMVFRYWGQTRWRQYDIARALLRHSPDIREVRESGILEQDRIDWSKYPGTHTAAMGDFLKQFAPTHSGAVKALPDDPGAAKAAGDEFFGHLKRHLSSGVPVIVHQYWTADDRRGHFRVVTAYDEKNKTVYLNDPRAGRIKQSYEKFFELWRVKEPWRCYYFLAFNVAGKSQKPKPLKIDLTRRSSSGSMAAQE